MDEGVDPRDMGRGVMDKVAQSEPLMAVADPDILFLFETWLEELESEVLSIVKKTNCLDPAELAGGLGLSRLGAKFLITKLEREGKI